MKMVIISEIETVIQYERTSKKASGYDTTTNDNNHVQPWKESKQFSIISSNDLNGSSLRPALLYVFINDLSTSRKE